MVIYQATKSANLERMRPCRCLSQQGVLLMSRGGIAKKERGIPSVRSALSFKPVDRTLPRNPLIRRSAPSASTAEIIELSGSESGDELQCISPAVSPVRASPQRESEDDDESDL